METTHERVKFCCTYFQIIENECSENVSAMLLVVTLATASLKRNRSGGNVKQLQRRDVGIALKNYSVEPSVGKTTSNFKSVQTITTFTTLQNGG